MKANEMNQGYCHNCGSSVLKGYNFCPSCGRKFYDSIPDLAYIEKRNIDIDRSIIYAADKKSQLVGFILCFLFGPLGLFYSSSYAAIIMTFISILGAIMTISDGFVYALITFPAFYLCIYILNFWIQWEGINTFNKRLRNGI